MADVVTMHEDEHPITPDLVRRLLRSQLPRWAEDDLVRVPSTGTVNAIFRLGTDLAVRLPRTPRWHDIDHEIDVLSRVRDVVPVAVPRPVHVGEPADGYPWKWAVFEWIDGETWSLDRLATPRDAARQVAEVIDALQRLDTTGGPRSTRGGRTAMAELDPGIRKAADEARSHLDVDAVLATWDHVRQARGWAGAPVWIHGDLLPANLLVRDGRLHGVIDWAGASVGDPARDLAAAWTLFDGADDGDARRTFQRSLPFDDGTWTRARAWALRRIHNVAYYAETNPGFSADAVRTIEQVVADTAATAGAGAQGLGRSWPTRST